MELILDVVCSKKKDHLYCRGCEVSKCGKGAVHEAEHGAYPLCYELYAGNTTKIRSIKQYMLAALYNAPATIDSYYRAEVNHDMAEGKI